MKTRTIAGDIRRIRSLMRLEPDIHGCVLRRTEYAEFLILLDAIETKAKRMQDALKPVLEIDANLGDLDEFEWCECKFCASADSGCWRGKAIGMQNAILKAKEIMKRQGSRNVRLLS